MKSKAFTLIEILVVLVIISIAVSFAVLSMGRSGQRELRSYAESIEQLIPTVAHYALITATSYGLRVQNNQLQVLRWAGSDKQWQLVTRPLAFKARPMPAESTLQLETKSAVAVIYTDGSMTPFTLNFMHGNTLEYQIKKN